MTAPKRPLGRVAPCSCGMKPLSLHHLERARTNAVCAARVDDVRLLARMVANWEDCRSVPEADLFTDGPTFTTCSARLAPRYLNPPAASPAAA